MNPRFLLGLLAAALLPAPSRSAEPTDGPVVIPRSARHDFTSRVNGRRYRIQVSSPFLADPAKAYPLFYVLDGNWYFLAAAENVTEAASTITPAIVVGVGYPTDDNDEVGKRRLFELTPTAGNAGWGKGGGGDAFLRVLLEEAKPWVEAHYRVDGAHQTLYGKSLGGLMVLRTLFLHPEAFQTYVAASPSIWWDHRVVLADEAGFSRRVREGGLHIRVLVTSADGEQYRGSDPKLLREGERYGAIDNASGLAARLAAAAPGNLQAQYFNFADENHVSVSLASLGRAINFALRQ
jgi:predicted alpha/beta superfamily hydrolase